jgi:hypothetical protein
MVLLKSWNLALYSKLLLNGQHFHGEPRFIKEHLALLYGIRVSPVFLAALCCYLFIGASLTPCIALAEQDAQNAEAVDNRVSGGEHFCPTAWFQILLDKDIGAMVQAWKASFFSSPGPDI